MDESPRFILPSADSISIDEEETFVTNLAALEYLGNIVHNFHIEGVDENLFLISNENELILKNISDFESKSNYTINLVAVDSDGNSVTKPLLIEVRDGNIFLLFLISFVLQAKISKHQNSFWSILLLNNVNVCLNTTVTIVNYLRSTNIIWYKIVILDSKRKQNTLF